MRISTSFFTRSIAVASQFVRTSTLNQEANLAGGITESRARAAITPPTWYGSPQFA